MALGDASARLRARLAGRKAPARKTTSSAEVLEDDQPELLRTPQVPVAAIDTASAPAATTSTPAARAAAAGTPAWSHRLAGELAEGVRAFRQRRRDEDIQRIGAPLETTLDALTASGRGIARMADEAVSGNNPLWSRDPDGGISLPFVEGAQSTRSSWRDVTSKLIPPVDVRLPMPPLMGPTTASAMQLPDLHVTGAGLATGTGLALDIAADPATYTGVGALTRAGRTMRAAKVGVRAAELELAGALSSREAIRATRKIRRAVDMLSEAERAAELEGTLASSGRALLTFGGQTNPMMAGGKLMAGAQGIMQKLQATNLMRRASDIFQPASMRVEPAVRARGFRVEAAAGVGRRQATREMGDLIAEYKPLLKAVGGDEQVLDDALSVAHERGQARQFHRPTDFLTTRERERYWNTQSDAVKDQLRLAGENRARVAVPSFLSPSERAAWRTANRNISMSQDISSQLGVRVEFSEQLAQKHLTRPQLRELNKARERMRKADDAFMRTPSGPTGVGSGFESLTDRPAVTQLPAAGAAPPPRLEAGVPPTYANPNDVRRVTELEQLVVQRETAARARSAEQLERTAKSAELRVADLTRVAQERANVQALQNSVLMAQRTYLRGATPEAKHLFGEFAGRMSKTINARNASMFLESNREGVVLSELADPLAFMLHATTPEAQRAILAAAVERGEIAAGMSWRTFTEKHASQITRKLRMTGVEANELARAGQLSITGGRKVQQFFFTNPLIAQVMREGNHASSVAYARHLRELSKVFGKPAALAPRNWRTVPNGVLGIGDDVAFEPEIADHLTRYHAAINNPGAILASWDRLQQIWKNWTLGVFPVYHTRNEVGDLINGVVLGGADLRHAGYAMDELMQGTSWARSVGRNAEAKPHFIDGRWYKSGEMRDEAEELGVLASAELRQTSEQLVRGPSAPRKASVRRSIGEARRGVREERALAASEGRAAPSRLQEFEQVASAGLYAAQRRLTDNAVIEIAHHVGDMREQGMRLTLYVDRRSRGWSPEAAALWVKKHLIDYGQASDTEQRGFMRVIPFYMWTRHNAPLQLEYLFAKPGLHATTQHVREAAAGDEPLGTGDTPLPTFLQQGLPIRAGTNQEGDPQFVRLEGTLPQTDAMKPVGWAAAVAKALSGGMAPGGEMADQALADVLSRTSPFLQAPIEATFNVDFWKSRGGRPAPLEQFSGEQGTFLGMSVPKRLMPLLETSRVLTELNRLNPGDVFGTDTKPSWAGETQDYPVVDPAARLGNLFLGRAYALNEGQQADRHSRAMKAVLNNIANEAADAEASGKTGRAAKYWKLYQHVLDHPELINPDMRR